MVTYSEWGKVDAIIVFAKQLKRSDSAVCDTNICVDMGSSATTSIRSFLW